MPHKNSLYGPALRLTRSASDAEDLVQDTLLRAYTRFDSFRSDGSPRAWLHTIMRNLFINAYRKKGRGIPEVSFDALDEAGVAVDLPEGSLKEGVNSPERMVVSRMESAAALRAVAALPQEYREVILLADVDGLAYQEIADRLDIPVGTVRSRLNRGRKRVQRALAAWRGEPATAPMRPLSSLPA